MVKETFKQELEHLINKHCLENDSDTPDFILANYLTGCLKIFNETLQAREKWYGREMCMNRKNDIQDQNDENKDQDIPNK
jgi:hypothetical protein